MSPSSEKAAKECALEFWRSLQFGEGTSEDVSGSLDAFKEANKIIEDVRIGPHSMSPLSPDLYAPSAWHAVCFLLFSYLKSRHVRGDYSDVEQFDKLFGLPMVFRGQSRPWDIIPSSWRDPGKAPVNRLRLELFHTCLKKTSKENSDPLFALFGNTASPSVSTSMAQHYGLPTDLVDFTFDPRIAFMFACWPGGGAPLSSPSLLADHAVVYFLSFFKLLHLSDLKLKFPHPSAKRLYRQSGFFIDFGPCPQHVAWSFYSTEKWTWVQQNCARLFFPRAYPDSDAFNELQRVSSYAFAPEEFIKGLADKIGALNEASLVKSGIADELLDSIETSPSWDYSRTFIQTDEEYVDVAVLLDRYVRCAAFLIASDGQHLDPMVIYMMARMDAQALAALEFIATNPVFKLHSQRLTWIRSKVLEAKELVAKYLRAYPNPQSTLDQT
jgi:hypothetical protein